jgi:hypothetical protein
MGAHEATLDQLGGRATVLAATGERSGSLTLDRIRLEPLEGLVLRSA